MNVSPTFSKPLKTAVFAGAPESGWTLTNSFSAGYCGRGEQLGGTTTRQRLDDVGVFCAFVVALVGVAAVFGQARVVVEDFRLRHRPRFVERIALGVDVVERRRERLAHRVRHGAFRRDQDQIALLTRGFVADQFGDIRVKFGEVAPKQKIIVCRHSFSLRFVYGN